MDVLKLIGLYGKRNIKKYYKQFLYCCVTIVFSISVILSISLITDHYKKNIDLTLSSINEADINIFSNDKTLGKNDIKVLEDLKEKGLIDYKLQLKKEVNIYNDNNIENCVLNLKIDNDFCSGNKITDNNIMNIVVNNQLASHLNIAKGDKVNINLNNKVQPCKVIDITDDKGLPLSDYEIELTSNILGTVKLNENRENFNKLQFNAALIYLKTDKNINLVLKYLNNEFNSDFLIRTKTDLYNNVKNKIDLQINIFRLLGISAFSICGISIYLTFYSINLQRKKDIAILKALGMRKLHLAILNIIDVLFISIITSILGFLITIICIKYLGSKYILNNFIFDSGTLRNVFKNISIIFIWMLGFSFIPFGLVSNTPIMSVLRNRAIGRFEKLKMLKWLLLLLVLCVSLIVIYTKTLLSIALIILFVLLLIIFYGIIYTCFLAISQIRRVLKSRYYFTFISIRSNCKSISFSSMFYIIGLTLLLFIGNIIFNLKGESEGYLRESNKFNGFVVHVNEVDKIQFESSLSKLNINDALRLSLIDSKIESINDKNINDIISTRFNTSKELRDNFKEYTNNIKILNVDNRSALVKYITKNNYELKNNEIIIVSNLFDILYKFKPNDTLKLNLISESKNMRVKFIEYDSLASSMNAYAITNTNINLNDKRTDNYSYIYLIDKDKNESNLIYQQILRDNPSIYMYKNDNLGKYINEYINKFSGVFMYITLISLISGIIFLLTNNYLIILKSKKDMSILYAFGICKKDIKKIYALFGAINGFLSSIGSVLISHYISKFIVEVITQNNYNYNLWGYLIIVLTSIIVNMLQYVYIVDKYRDLEFYNCLKENE